MHFLFSIITLVFVQKHQKLCEKGKDIAADTFFEELKESSPTQSGDETLDPSRFFIQ